MKNITHYVKNYKGMEIWKSSSGNYFVRYMKPNIYDGIVYRSSEFSSIKKCKDFINDLRGE
jgi:hypothetical protein